MVNRTSIKSIFISIYQPISLTKMRDGLLNKLDKGFKEKIRYSGNRTGTAKIKMG